MRCCHKIKRRPKGMTAAMQGIQSIFLWFLVLHLLLQDAIVEARFSLSTAPTSNIATNPSTTLLASATGSRSGTKTRRIPVAFAFDDPSFLWGLRITSAVASYSGFVSFFDRPQGQLIEKADDYLQVKESTVPGAGLGLFAKVTIPKNTILGTYPGVVLPLHQNLAKLQRVPMCEGYIWRFSDNQMVIDPTNNEGVLENSCRGGNPSMPLSIELHKLLNLQVPTVLCRINEPPLGKDVNVVTNEDREKRQVVFSLERDVYEGEELFIDYGLSYDRSRYGAAVGS